MKKLLGKRRLIFAAVTVMALGIVSLGYAAWTSSGNGTGFAKASTAQALTSVTVVGGERRPVPRCDGRPHAQAVQPQPVPGQRSPT